MNLKGKSTFVFKRNGHVVKMYREDNLVTNAVDNILSPNFVANAFGGKVGGSLITSYTPIRQLFGGLLLFDNEIDSDVIIPTKNEFSHFVGCAGGAYDGNSIVRGYLDSSKSIYEDNYMKEVFVFDLEKCNHDIKTICLSSLSGGAGGLSKLDDTKTSFLSGYGLENVNSQTTKCRVGLGEANYIVPYIIPSVDGYLIGTDTNGNLVCVKNTDGVLTVKKFGYKGNIGFNDTIREFDYDSFINTYGGSISNCGLFTQVYEKNITIPFDIVNEKEMTLLGDTIYSSKFIENGQFIVGQLILNDDGISCKYGTIETDITNTIETTKTIGQELYAISGTTLYIINLPKLSSGGVYSGTYNIVETLEPNLTIIPFKDTVMLIQKNGCLSGESQNIYFLTDNNTLLKQQVILGNDIDTQLCRGICFNLSEPLVGLICSGEVNGIEVDSISVNMVTPYLSTINVLTTSQYKAATTALEISYELTIDND